MNDQIDAIAQAAGGAQGLSELAEMLHNDIASFAAQSQGIPANVRR